VAKIEYNRLSEWDSSGLVAFEDEWVEAVRRDRLERRVRMEEKKERKRRRKKRKRRGER